MFVLVVTGLSGFLRFGVCSSFDCFIRAQTPQFAHWQGKRPVLGVAACDSVFRAEARSARPP